MFLAGGTSEEGQRLLLSWCGAKQQLAPSRTRQGAVTSPKISLQCHNCHNIITRNSVVAEEGAVGGGSAGRTSLRNYCLSSSAPSRKKNTKIKLPFFFWQVFFLLPSFASNCDFSAGFHPTLRSPNCLGISRRSARGCNGTAGIPCGRHGTCCLLQMLPLKINKCAHMIYIFISSAGGLCVACREGQRAFLA